MQKTLKTA